MLYSAFSHINGERFRKPTDMLMSNKKQRIGLVLSMVPAYSETFFRNKIAVLEKAGFEVILFTGGGKDEQRTIRNIRVGYDSRKPGLQTILPKILAGFRLLLHARRSVRLYKKNKLDGFTTRNNFISLLNSAHIIGHDLEWLHFGFATNAIYIENLAAILGAKLAVSIRGFDIGIYPLKQPGCYRLLWERIDKLHYISDDLYQLALADGLSPEKPAIKIEPAVDTSIPARLAKPSETIIETPGFLTIGRLHWKKGYPLMLHALSKLRSEGIDFTYHIIGDGEDMEQLVYLVRMHGLDQQVKLTGRKSHGETLALLNGCDIYLQYSIQEGFCNAVLEAQLLGRLCIVSDAEGLSENVLHEQTGWVVPRNEVSLLKERILSVLQMQETERQKIRDAASRRIREKFSLEVQQKKFIGFYES